MEAKLRTSMMRVKTPLDFIDRPIAMILFGIIVLILAANLWGAIKAWRNRQVER